MGDRGPAPKARTVRDRDGKVNETLHWDGKIRGFDLPDEALEENEVWHPVVLKWWDSFRRSPQARLIVTDVQWWDLVSAMRVYQDFWTGKARGRTLRSAELRAILAGYLVSPAAARRSGIEITLPPTDEAEAEAEAAKTRGPGTVTSLESRRNRLMQDQDAEPAPAQAAKKTVARKAPAKKTAAKKTTVKNPPAKKPATVPARKVVKKAVARTTRKT